jgi:glucose/arabinose dehydrogenase
MAFDRQTGQLWAADVGQNMFEEINLLRAGGDYGWNLREAEHPFGANGVDLRPDLVEPIWEYDHDIGKSITGGFVYRGQQVPALSGAYLYADYVTTRMWALRYDPARGRVVANQPVKNPGLAVMSFGEDEQGEAYALTASPNGRGIHRIVKAAAD